MAKLPDKFSVGHPVILDSTNGHPVRPVDVNGVALDDSTTSFSVAHPVIETDANGVVLLDSTKSFSMVRKVRIDPKGTPIITIDTSGTALGTTLGISGGSVGAPVYDTRFGTSTNTSNGRVTFDSTGATITWLDSINGNDTNNGSTLALAKKSLASAAVALTTNYVAGTQSILRVAGGQGQTYTDTGATNLDGKGGPSLAHPTLIQSYDSTDPTNTSKYGWLVGGSMPSIRIDTGGTTQLLTSVNANGASNFAVQGIEFDGNGGGFGQNAAGFINQHNGIFFQNCRFKECGVGIDSSTDSRCTTIHFSRCSFWGNWCGSTSLGGAVGNCQGIYLGNVDGAYIQDNAFIHCGWKIGAARGDAASAGGSTAFAHAHYYHASSINGKFDRNFYMDSSCDGFNFRGAGTASVIVTLDEPISLTMGAFTSTYLEAPSGVLQVVDDVLVMGGVTDVNIAGSGNCIRTTNTILGSHLNNAVVVDNPARSGSNSLVLPYRADPSMVIDQYITISNLRAYNAAGGLETSATNSQIHDTWLNDLVDSLSFTMPSTTLTNTIVHSGLTTYPNAKTRDQIITALLQAVNITPGADYTARKNQLANIVAWRPDINWPQKLIDIGFSAYGATPQYASASVPDLSSETPRIIYGSAAWTPSSSIGGAAYWYDPSDITTLFKDTAGTIPVASDGDVVKRINDKSGNGLHMTAHNATGWVYHTNSGKPYLSMDGTEYFESISGSVTDANGQVVIGAAVNCGNGSFLTGNLAYQSFLQIQSGSLLQAMAQDSTWANTVTDNTFGWTPNTNTVISQITSSTTIQGFINGTGDGSISTAGFTLNHNPDNLHLGFATTGRFSGVAGIKGASTTDHTNLITYLTAKM